MQENKINVDLQMNLHYWNYTTLLENKKKMLIYKWI